MPTLSPHAIVECPENLAEGVTVGPFAYIGPDVHIGAGTQVDNNVTLNGRVRIGDQCHVYPFAVIGQADSNDGGHGIAEIGDRSKIREHAVICCGAPDGRGTRIGSDNLVMTGCYIGPDVHIGDHIVLGNYCQFADRSSVESHVWAAAFTGTNVDVTIGQYSFTSGYAGIDRDAPPFAILQGYPFRVRGINALNLRRCGFDEKQISGLKGAFRRLFDDSGAVATDTIDALAQQDDLDEHLRYLLEYLKLHSPDPAAQTESPSSGRGI